MAEVVRLELVWSEREARSFLGVWVDGRALPEAQGQDLVSCLGWFAPEEDRRAAGRLLGEVAPDVEDRVAVYVCPECGDVLCGALTARITHSEREVVWTDFAFSWFDSEVGRWEHESVGQAEYHFAADAYRRTMTDRTRG